MSRSLGIAALGALLLSTAPALAAGSSSPNLISNGYIDIHGGLLHGTDTYSDPAPPDDTYVWPGYLFGGAARGVVVIDPQLTVQGDLWANHFTWDDGSGPDSSSELGAAAHLTWHMPDNQTLLGLLGSAGIASDWDDGLFSTVGAEAVYNGDNWRLYGQAGVTFGVTGDAAANHDVNVGGTIAADYFIDPNLMLSASLGAGRWNADYGSGGGLDWGAKLEYKPDGSPASFYVAYQGLSWTRNYPGPASDVGVEHEVVVGLRIPFGEGSLQDMQTNVGLADMNGAYGDFLNR